MVIPKSIDEQTGFTTPIVYRNDSDHYANNMLSYTKNWAQAFNSNKWSGYIFVSSHIDISIAFEASRLVLQEYIPGVVFNHPEEFIKRVDESILNKLRK